MHEKHDRMTRYGDRIDAGMHHAIEAWKDDPDLGDLYQSLHAHTDRRTFYNAWAEAIIARHLTERGCALRFEVPTPSGKRCDFEVTRDDDRFYLHVKRLETERVRKKKLRISSRLRLLERIARPYVVNLRWHEGLTDRQMQRLVTEGERFILQARVGDELTVRDDLDGKELGGLQIIAPGDSSHVTLTIGLPDGFIDETPRIRKLMSRAYRQFMPKEVNVILLGTSHPEEARDVETALLGSHIERWDAFPPRGKRIAHGRAADGFWHERKHEMSQAAGWFHFGFGGAPMSSRLWLRRGVAMDEPVRALLSDLFEPADSAHISPRA